MSPRLLRLLRAARRRLRVGLAWVSAWVSAGPRQSAPNAHARSRSPPAWFMKFKSTDWLHRRLSSMRIAYIVANSPHAYLRQRVSGSSPPSGAGRSGVPLLGTPGSPRQSDNA